MRRALRRMISILLALVMLLSLLPAAAYADISQTIGNSRTENEEILDQLRALTGSEQEAQALYLRLQALGVLGEDGWVTEELVIDGESYSLEEAISFVDALPDDTVVQVGDTAITAGDLKIMLAIEAEIAAIRDEWYDGQDWTPEQLEALASLQNALDAGTFSVESRSGGDTVVGGVNHNTVLEVSQEAGDGFVTFTFERDSTSGDDVTFEVTPILGLTGGTQIVEISGNETTGEATFQCASTDGIYSTVEHYCGIRLDNIENALFYNEDGNLHSYGTYYTDATGTVTAPEGFVTSATLSGEINGDLLAKVDEEVRDSILAGTLNQINLGDWSNNQPLGGNKYYGQYGDFYFGTVIQGTNDRLAVERPSNSEYRYPNPNYDATDTSEPTLNDGKSYAFGVIKWLNAKISLFGTVVTDFWMGFPGAYPEVDNITSISNELEGYGLGANCLIGNTFMVFEKVDGVYQNRTDYYEGNSMFPLTIDKEMREKIVEGYISGNTDVVIGDGNIYQASGFYYNDSQNRVRWNPSQDVGPYDNSSSLDQAIDATFTDALTPTVESWSVPAGTYYPGQQIPITVKFSEPVDLTQTSLTLNNTNGAGLQPVFSDASEFRYSNVCTFLYTVPLNSTAGLTLTSVSMVDVSGTKVTDTSEASRSAFSAAASGVSIRGPQITSAFSSLAVTGSPVPAAGGTVTIRANVTSGYENTVLNGNYRVYARVLCGDETLGIYRLTAGDSTGTYYYNDKVVLPANSTAEQQTYLVDLWYTNDQSVPDPPATTDDLTLYFGTAASFQQSAPAFVGEDDISLAFARGDGKTGTTVDLTDGLTEEQNTRYSFDLKFTSPYTSYTWGGLDDFTFAVQVPVEGADDLTNDDNWTTETTTQIANIGTVSITDTTTFHIPITFTGAAGTFRLTVTAENGDVANQAVTVCSEAVTVIPPTAPTLQIGSTLRDIRITAGDTVTVRWFSNLTDKQASEHGTSINFNIDVYEHTGHNYNPGTAADPDNPTMEEINAENSPWELIGSFTEESTQDHLVTEKVLNTLQLSQVSVGSGCSYAIRVSATYGDNVYEEETYEAWAYVYVISRPAVVDLDNLDLYWTQTSGAEGVQLNWTLQNLDIANQTDAQFQLTVTNNDTNEVVASASLGDITWDGEGTNRSGTFTFPFAPMADTETGGGTNWRDTYTVELRAKNGTDSTWSYDSAVLYYYADAAFQLYVGGDPVSGETLTWSNETNATDGLNIAGMSQAEILALNRAIYLADTVGLNPNMTWSNVADQVVWKVEGDSVTLNYCRGTLYENIDLFDYVSYNPGTEFMLSGVGNGTTTITATHRDSGGNLTDSVTIDVEILQDKLYLFQVYPAATTENTTVLEYVNGAGETKTHYADATGAAAIYEPSGIASDVSVRTVVTDASGNRTTYVGTFAQSTLRSGEADSTRLELYPLNTMKLREVSTAQLFLKQADGSPYTDEVTIHAGVYKNGEYCREVTFSTDPLRAQGNLHEGGGDGFTADIGNDGKLTIYMDVSEFYTPDETGEDRELQSDDQLTFMFLVETANNQYYPVLLERNAMMSQSETVRFGESIVTLRATNGQQQPCVVIQEADFGSGGSTSVIGFTGKVGPSTVHPSLDLRTTVLWWGQDGVDADWSARIYDSTGAAAPNQTTTTWQYEFFDEDLWVTQSVVHMDQWTIGSWLPPMTTLGLELRYFDGSGALLRTEPQSFRAVNAMNVGDPTTNDGVTENMQALLFALVNGMLGGSGSGESYVM